MKTSGFWSSMSEAWKSLFHPTKKKLKKTEKSTNPLISVRGVKSQGKPLSPKLERQAGAHRDHNLLGK